MKFSSSKKVCVGANSLSKKFQVKPFNLTPLTNDRLVMRICNSIENFEKLSTKSPARKRNLNYLDDQLSNRPSFLKTYSKNHPESKFWDFQLHRMSLPETLLCRKTTKISLQISLNELHKIRKSSSRLPCKIYTFKSTEICEIWLRFAACQRETSKSDLTVQRRSHRANSKFDSNHSAA